MRNATNLNGEIAMRTLLLGLCASILWVLAPRSAHAMMDQAAEADRTQAERDSAPPSHARENLLEMARKTELQRERVAQTLLSLSKPPPPPPKVIPTPESAEVSWTVGWKRLLLTRKEIPYCV